VSGPIVAQAGIVCIELRQTSPGRYDVWSAGEVVGTARDNGANAAVTVGDITAASYSMGRAAVMAAVRLSDHYRDWCHDQPVTARGMGGAAGDAA
jgi:hypothetical protein